MADSAAAVVQPQAVVIQGNIQYCQPHWSELMFALIDRQLQPFMSENPDELTERLQRGERDACFEAHSTITSLALQVFSPLVVLQEHNGCPACAFANIINHTADSMAVRFRKPQ